MATQAYDITTLSPDIQKQIKSGTPNIGDQFVLPGGGSIVKVSETGYLTGSGQMTTPQGQVSFETQQVPVRTPRETADANILLQQQSLERELARIESETQQRIAEQQQLGVESLAKTRGINIRAGLAGSPFAEALKSEVTTATAKSVTSERQRGGELGEKARGAFNENIQKIEENYNTRQAQIEANQLSVFNKNIELATEAKKQALGDFDLMAKSGQVDFEKMRSSGLLEGYAKQIGKSIGELELRFNAQLPQAEASDFRWGKNGEAYQYNKLTGEFIRRPDLDEGAGAAGFEGKVQMLGDQIFIVPDKFTYDPTNPKSQADQLKDQMIPYGVTGQFQVPKVGVVKPPTSAQTTVAEYASRMEQAEPTLKSLESKIVEMNFLNFEAQIKLPSALQNVNIQQYLQAGRNFINAKLRRESGAVISPTEFSEARKQYLPQPGDKPETLTMKEENRKLVFVSMKKAAGTAYSSVEELLSGNVQSGAEDETYTTPEGEVYIKGEDGLYYPQ